MKKLLSLCLILALLIPAFPAVRADVTAEPFYVLGWDGVDEETYPHLAQLVTAEFTCQEEIVAIGYGELTLTHGSYTEADVTAFATALKTAMDARPQGQRYWYLAGIGEILAAFAENVLFSDEGVAQMQALFTDILNKMTALHCPLDGVILDIDYTAMTSDAIYTDAYAEDSNIYLRIVKDRRYGAQIRPILEANGFYFWPNPQGQKSEIYSICKKNKKDEHIQARKVWDACMGIHLKNITDKWCTEPLLAAYPKASLSDCRSYDASPWEQIYAGGSGKIGTASGFTYDYSHADADFYESQPHFPTYNGAVYEASPFNSLLCDINFTRQMYSATDTKQLAPRITSYVYGSRSSQKVYSIAKTPYYAELLYHLGLFDPEPFLTDLDVRDYGDKGSPASETSKDYILTQQVMNDVLAELSRVAGFSDRKPIEMPVNWNQSFILSGMYANGRNLWRITPNADKVALADFQIAGNDPTFYVAGQTITFPGGKLIADTQIPNAGSCGYWVETAADVNPVVNSDADRFAKAPAFEENFNSYPDGQMTNKLMNNAYAWDYGLIGGTSNIVNKALHLTGTVSYKNSVIPEKITAGGSYAPKQTWQITFTLPEKLGEKAEIHLLKYEGQGTAVTDGGLRVFENTLYYSILLDKDDPVKIRTEYKALCKLEPGTYTVKRMMDMADPESFTYTVSLCNASGKEIAKLKDIECPAFTKITNIGFNANRAEQTVIFDDYKLYPTCASADISLYDANGADVTDKAPAGSSTYRLSWLNASAVPQQVRVTAANYQGDQVTEEKVIREFTVEPGCDGVETGTLELAEGQQVQVSVLALAQEEVQKDNTWLIILAAAAALIAIVVVICILKKKRK